MQLILFLLRSRVRLYINFIPESYTATSSATLNEQYYLLLVDVEDLCVPH